MAKITLSPLVTDIRGKVGPTVFSKWKGINTVRALVIPGNPRTLLQRIARGFTYAVSKAWARQTEAYKAQFNAAASGQGISGNNLYMKTMAGFNARFRDFRTTASAAAAAGANSIIVTADAPLTSPSFVDSLGIVEGAKLLIGAQPTVYTAGVPNRDTNTIPINPALSAAVAAGDPVRVAGVAAPGGAAWTYPV